MNMEISIVSKEIIKPSSPTIHQQKPYKLSLFDQITPSTYAPLIIFYSLKSNLNATHLLPYAKASLSETLNLFYPLSGRLLKDDTNFLVHKFDSGVPIFEAKANFTISDYLNDPKLELLNMFLPCTPYQNENGDYENLPPFLVQFTIFSCGSLAVGGCLWHKIGDGATVFAFSHAWTCIMYGLPVKQPDLDIASSLFPPRSNLLQRYVSTIERWWFQPRNYVTRRFVFDVDAITAIRAKAAGDKQEQAMPSRVQALSAFVWKWFMYSSQVVNSFSSNRSCMLGLAVNMRQRVKTLNYSLQEAVGNLFWPTVAVFDDPEIKDVQLKELVKLINKAVEEFNEDYIQNLQHEEGFELILKSLDMMEELLSIENADFLAISSWCNLGINNIEVESGAPVWLTPGTYATSNVVVFIEINERKGIEAWINLDEKIISVLEKHPQFLAFATPNPNVDLIL